MSQAARRPRIIPVGIPVSKPNAGSGNAASPAVPALQVLRAVAQVLARESLRDALSGLTTHLSRDMLCSRVSVGFGDGQRVKLEFASDAPTSGQLSELLVDVQTAMEEAWSQGGSVCHPNPAGDSSRTDLAHAQLARGHGNVSVCSVPLAQAGRRIGVMTFQRDLGDPFTHDDVKTLEHICAFLSPLVELKLERERPWVKRLGSQTRRTWFSGDKRRVTTLIGAAVLAIIALSFIPIDAAVRAPARLEGVIQRAIVAPQDGYISAVMARPGDTVVRNQPLAELERENLELERRRWESEVAKTENAFGEALSKQDRAEIVIQQARIDGAKAQLDLVRSDLARSTLRAPFAGVILEGDLTRSVGAPVKRGESLMSIAPSTGFRLMLQVDERDIARVSKGQWGKLQLAATPGDPLAIVVTRITPVASTQSGKNVFEVEARVMQERPGLRPGLEGVAKLDAGSRPIAMVVGGRAIDWLRLQFWSWWG